MSPSSKVWWSLCIQRIYTKWFADIGICQCIKSCIGKWGDSFMRAVERCLCDTVGCILLFMLLINYQILTWWLIDLYFSFPPTLILRGMSVLWRLHEGSCPQTPLHSEWMGNQPGVSGITTWQSLLFHTDMMGTTVHKEVESMDGWILNSL